MRTSKYQEDLNLYQVSSLSSENKKFISVAGCSVAKSAKSNRRATKGCQVRREPYWYKNGALAQENCRNSPRNMTVNKEVVTYAENVKSREGRAGVLP